MVESIIEFDRPKISPSIIMVAGVGGGGSNAVNHMYEMGIRDVSFMVCNTDRQALYRSQIPLKVRLGDTLTQGLGAGNNPERGREAALESLDEIVEIFKREGTKMVFITAGMGGGTGTGAAPVIAKAAKELGILTVAIVTIPFKTEGKKRLDHAFEGIGELKQCVDSLLLINNENIQEIYGKLTLSEAFGKADDILATAAKGIAEIITRDNVVNVDFADVNTVMCDSGIALMGSGMASGENRAMEVANSALSSPLLNHNDIIGARNILINITSGEKEITLEETYLITEYIQERAGNNADIIWGAGNDTTLGDNIAVTIIATGFNLDLMPGVFDRMPRSPMQEYMDAAARSAVDESQTEDEPMTADADESEANTTKPRWTPPQHSDDARRFNRPLMPRPIAPAEMEPIPSAPTSAAPASVSPLMRNAPTPAPAPHAIESKSNADSAINVDELEKMPAFVRRNVKFVRDSSDEVGRSGRVSLKNETNQSEQKSEGSSLFD